MNTPPPTVQIVSHTTDKVNPPPGIIGKPDRSRSVRSPEAQRRRKDKWEARKVELSQRRELARNQCAAAKVKSAARRKRRKPGRQNGPPPRAVSAAAASSAAAAQQVPKVGKPPGARYRKDRQGARSKSVVPKKRTVQFPLDMSEISAINNSVAVGEMTPEEATAKLLATIWQDRSELVEATTVVHDNMKRELESPRSWATGLVMAGSIPVHATPIYPGVVAQVLVAPGVVFRTVGRLTSSITCLFAGMTAVISAESPGARLIGLGTSSTWGFHHVQGSISGSWDIGAESCSSTCECVGVCEHILELEDPRATLVFVVGPGFKGKATKFLAHGAVCLLSASGSMVRSTQKTIAIEDEAPQPYVRSPWWTGRSRFGSAKLSGRSFGSGVVNQFEKASNKLGLSPGSAIDLLWPEELHVPGAGLISSACAVDVSQTLVDRVASTSIGRVPGDLTTRLGHRTAVRLTESGEHPLLASEGATARVAIALAERYNLLYPLKTASYRGTTGVVRFLTQYYGRITLAIIGSIVVKLASSRLRQKSLELAAIVAEYYRDLKRSVSGKLLPGSALMDKSVEAITPQRPFFQRLFWTGCEEAFKKSLPYGIGAFLLGGFEMGQWVKLGGYDGFRQYLPTFIMHFAWWYLTPLNGFLFHAAYNEWIYSVNARYPTIVRDLRLFEAEDATRIAGN